MNFNVGDIVYFDSNYAVYCFITRIDTAKDLYIMSYGNYSSFVHRDANYVNKFYRLYTNVFI